MPGSGLPLAIAEAVQGKFSRGDGKEDLQISDRGLRLAEIASSLRICEAGVKR